MNRVWRILCWVAQRCPERAGGEGAWCCGHWGHHNCHVAYGGQNAWKVTWP